MDLGKTIAVGVFAVLLLSIGVVCLVWPERIQQSYSRYDAANRKVAERLHLPDWWVNWMMRPSSILELRVVGVIAICGSTFLFFALIKGLER